MIKWVLLAMLWAFCIGVVVPGGEHGESTLKQWAVILSAPLSAPFLLGGMITTKLMER